LQIKPAGKSKHDLVISCGIHGNETAPIEIVSRLISQIAKGVLTPRTNLLFILGNPRAMQISERFVSLNMNRLFAGAHQNYPHTEDSLYELERADELERLVSDFFSQNAGYRRTHLDLHTAIKPSYHKTFAIRPYSGDRINESARELLVAMGIEAVLQHNKPSTTFSSYSVSKFGAEAYTLELGKVMPFGENRIEDFHKAIDCLNKLVENQKFARVDASNLIEYKVVAEIIRQTDNFRFNVAESVENFTPFPQGYLIAEDENYNYRVAFQEESIVFPNRNVPVGQRVAVMVTRVDQD